MGWKITVIHYKTIEFNIKIILNIHNSQYFGALRAQSVIMQEYVEKALYFTTKPLNLTYTILYFSPRYAHRVLY